jgi:hypothetical protein
MFERLELREREAQIARLSGTQAQSSTRAEA